MNRKNFVALEGGLTKDPEVHESPGVVHLSLAIDGAGSEKGVSFPTGYFDVKVWLNDSDYTPAITAKNIRAAIADGSLKKGSRVSVMGTLKQERWTKDGVRSSKVVVVADMVEVYTKQSTGSYSSTNVAAEADSDQPVFSPSF